MEFRAEIANIIRRVHTANQHVVVTRRGKPMAVLIPLGDFLRLRQLYSTMPQPVEDKTVTS